MPSAMPNEGDLHTFLVATGLRTANLSEASDALDLPGAVGAAVLEWERLTKYEPFVSASTDLIIPFSPDDVVHPPNEMPILDLDGGFVTVTSVKVGVTPDNPTGTTLVLNQDYFLRPARAASKGKPWSWLELYGGYSTIFPSGLSQYPDSIRVTGKRGYSLTVPHDVFQAVLAKAAEITAPRVSLALSGGLVSWKEADSTSEQYGQNPLGGSCEGWSTQFKKTVSRYRRIPVK